MKRSRSSFVVASLLSAATVASIVALAPSAHAEESKRGVALGARLAYGAPMGNAEAGLPMADLVGGMLAVGLDLGYRFNRHWYVGAQFQFGVIDPPTTACGAGSTCNGTDMQFALVANYHVLPTHVIDPWIGLGMGYESTHLSTSDTGADTSSFELHGVQLFDIQLGADLKLIDNVPFGPYLGFSVTQYANGSSTSPSGVETNLNFDGAMHDWLMLGVRGQFQL